MSDMSVMSDEQLEDLVLKHSNIDLRRMALCILRARSYRDGVRDMGANALAAIKPLGGSKEGKPCAN